MFIGSYRVFLDDSIVLGGEWIICILVFNHLEGIIDTKEKIMKLISKITRGQSVKERKKKQERRQSVVVMLIRILIYYSLVARPTVRSPG